MIADLKPGTLSETAIGAQVRKMQEVLGLPVSLDNRIAFSTRFYRVKLTYGDTQTGILLPDNALVVPRSLTGPARGGLRLSRITGIELQPDKVTFDAEELGYVLNAQDRGFISFTSSPVSLVLTPKSFGFHFREMTGISRPVS